jgi:hypothetical protein
MLEMFISTYKYGDRKINLSQLGLIFEKQWFHILILAGLIAIPAVYLFYSVKRYFGFKRAFGIDHFDTSYQTRPFVKEGIFRYTGNGMYTFGFFLLWIPGLWYASIAALWVALFNHLYIWVHYYSTELPDIKRIYQTNQEEP